MGVAWGVLSTAKINDKVLAGAAESDRADVIAVASRDAAKAEAYAREKGIERAYGSYEALLEDSDVEAVYISLPNAMHAEWSIRALEAGKHVLCEKPFSRRAADVVRAFDVADRADRLLMEAFMYRHNPQTRRLKELVERGAIGRLRHVRSAFSFAIGDPEVNVRMDAQLEGGALMDVGCYCVSGARLLAGEPERVYGERETGASGVDVRFAATMRFPDDVTAQFDCGIVLFGRGELEAVGEEGSLLVSDPWHAREPLIELRRDDSPNRVERIETDVAQSYRLELENFGDAIHGEAEPLLGRGDALGQARTIEALYRSAEDAGAVSP